MFEETSGKAAIKETSVYEWYNVFVMGKKQILSGA
jgi:hypothetical protein